MTAAPVNNSLHNNECKGITAADGRFEPRSVQEHDRLLPVGGEEGGLEGAIQGLWNGPFEDSAGCGNILVNIPPPFSLTPCGGD